MAAIDLFEMRSRIFEISTFRAILPPLILLGDRNQLPTELDAYVIYNFTQNTVKATLKGTVHCVQEERSDWLTTEKHTKSLSGSFIKHS